MTKKILCTLGPASLNEQAILRLDDLGVNLFRINLSHTKLEDIPGIITFVKSKTHIPLCLDTEGAQVRNGSIENGSVMMHEHGTVRVLGKAIIGNDVQFSLYPDYIVKELMIGDFVSVDFDSVLLQVVDNDGDSATMRVLNGGKMGQNKAVTVDRPITMSPLTDKDKAAIKIGREMGINYFALSFANQDKDVDIIRTLAGENAFIISKIECQNGVTNLDGIAEKSNAILIDRGDLSREFPIERIPSLQERIINHCKIRDTEVYVATNLLESMIHSAMPTRAEVNDIYTTLRSGADGLVLAAETAIGHNPIACANMVIKVIHSYESDQRMQNDGLHDDKPKSLLVDPHGGHLISRMKKEEEIEYLESLRKIQVELVDLMECEQIATGTYSPISGFMDRETLDSVLETNRLPSGLIWTMPVILQVPCEKSSILPGDRLALTDNQGIIYSTLDVSEVFQINLEAIAQKWYGTNSKKHPGVAMFMKRGENCIAGEITLVRQFPSMHRHYQLSPAQTRSLFNHKGWSRVVGFHSRNPPHRIHEYIQLTALTNSHADGLFISPVIGPKKVEDFQSDLILRSYEIMINKGVYPERKVVLGSFSTYPRYCGPRETVFTMLCRKNMGCSHFIIGRDHAGVGTFYKLEDNYKLLENLGDIGIKPILFEEIGYSPIKKEFSKVGESKEILKISGTDAREALRNNRELPDWFMRTEVQSILRDAIERGVEVIHQ